MIRIRLVWMIEIGAEQNFSKCVRWVREKYENTVSFGIIFDAGV